MAENKPTYLTSIRTTYGDLPYDYNSLYGKPESDTKLETAGKFADAQVVGNRIRVINTKLETINTQIKDIKDSTHVHSADDITSGTLNAERLPSIPVEKLPEIPTEKLPVVPLTKGGTGAKSGQDGLTNLLASGAMILSTHQYGTLEDRDKLSPVEGQIFFVKVQ